MSEYQLVVSIPKGIRKNDIRWAILKMTAGRTYAMRLENAQRVLSSRSKYVEAKHREMALDVLDGTDPLSRKGMR